MSCPAALGSIFEAGDAMNRLAGLPALVERSSGATGRLDLERRLKALLGRFIGFRMLTIIEKSCVATLSGFG